MERVNQAISYSTIATGAAQIAGIIDKLGGFALMMLGFGVTWWSIKRSKAAVEKFRADTLKAEADTRLANKATEKMELEIRALREQGPKEKTIIEP